MILKSLKKKIDCATTLTLIKCLFEAGYILNVDRKKVGKKNAKIFKTKTSTAQGIVSSPLLNNIVLDELDTFINKDLKIKSSLLRKFRKVPSKRYNYSNFKRLYYIRYVDDWFILLAGSFEKTKEIYKKVSNKLKSLGLTLNLQTLHIISVRNDPCRFLGINFFISKNTGESYKSTLLIKKNITIRQPFLPRIVLHVPIEELLLKLKEKGFVKRNNKGVYFPIGKSNCILLTHSQTLNYFNSLIHGIFNYYGYVQNRNALWPIVRFLYYSCALTLARKYRFKTLGKTFKQFGRDLEFVNEKKKNYITYKPFKLRMLSIN